jgi:hypothetical protein
LEEISAFAFVDISIRMYYYQNVIFIFYYCLHHTMRVPGFSIKGNRGFFLTKNGASELLGRRNYG